MIVAALGVILLLVVGRLGYGVHGPAHWLPFIVTLIVAGSLWIMAHLNANMMPASAIMEMQR